MSTEHNFIGIDVGTGSVRAALLKKDGTILASSTQDTLTWRDERDHRVFEQSTTNIWGAIIRAVRSCLETAHIAASSVRGLGFDATCSLAVTDFDGVPVVVTKGDQLGAHGERNIILWADHRAEQEANLINATNSVVLEYVGGNMSLEMEVPKVLWLKNNMAATRFSRCQFFDLPDYLTYRATNDNARSCCSVTCKCSFVPETGWQADFFRDIGLEELVMNDYKQIGAADRDMLIAGLPVGRGLSKESAEELGLLEGTPVGGALIDAYAGWLGTVASRYEIDGMLSDVAPSLEESGHRLAAVAGTSTCHIVQSRKKIFIPGVWGPYKDPIFRGWWMNEGGQSSTGQLIEFLLTTHSAYPELVALANSQKKDVYAVLIEILIQHQSERKNESLSELVKDIHIYPDFHGNRSPIADLRMRGSIIGLELDKSLTDIAKKYYAALTAIALQTRHIVETLIQAGHRITSIYMSGGQAANRELIQLLADTCGIPVVVPGDPASAVVRGAAMLGCLAADSAERAHDVCEDEQANALWSTMVQMSQDGIMIQPKASRKENAILEAKFKIFLDTIHIQKRWRQEMDDATK